MRVVPTSWGLTRSAPGKGLHGSLGFRAYGACDWGLKLAAERLR